MSLRQIALTALQDVRDRATGQPLVSAKGPLEVRLERGVAHVDIALPYPARSCWEALGDAVRAALAPLQGVDSVEVHVSTRVTSREVQRGIALQKGVRNIIAVASGKGGVGKSTTAANLALALAAEGARVGILDADIHGPSQPLMLGVEGRPESLDGKLLQPLSGHGLQVMSIGFMVDQNQPVIWRGPMATQALEQLLRQTDWNDLDYLVVDLPPGTGDIQLTLAQKVPLTGAVIVTTPQDVALLDARKGIEMFEKVGVPIIGIVENMAVHTCSHCGHAEHIFGADGGRRLAEGYGVPYLGALPLDIAIRRDADDGRPTVVADPQGAIAGRYVEIARAVAARVAAKAKDYSAKFPTITVSTGT